MGFFGMFLLMVVVTIALVMITMALMPKPKRGTPDMAKDMEMPTSEAGRPVPVIFGDGTIKSPNCLWYGETKTSTHEINI